MENQRRWIWDENNNANLAWFEVDNFPANSILFNGEVFVSPVHNNGQIIEGATQQEQEQAELEKVNVFVSDFRKLRKETARQFSDEFADNLTKVLIGKPSSEVDVIDEQLIDTAHKIIDRINSRNSDYWTARREINLMVAPTNVIALQFFNDLKTHVNDFVNNNYPTEEL